MTLLHLAVIVTLGVQPPMQDKPAPKLATGQQFRRALDSKLKQARWDKVAVQSILDDLAKGRKISIILDRRLDPTLTPEITVANISLRDLLNRVAASIKAKAVIVGNIVYIGPANSATTLPQLIKQRDTELSRVARSLPLPKRLKMTQRRTAHWNDLDTPREVIQQLGKELDLSIKGINKIPHDLMRSATVPKASRSQPLSLLLIQFGLTFKWAAKGTGIEIVPLKTPGNTKKGPTQ